jgi:hypothetical protein
MGENFQFFLPWLNEQVWGLGFFCSFENFVPFNFWLFGSLTEKKAFVHNDFLLLKLAGNGTILESIDQKKKKLCMHRM